MSGEKGEVALALFYAFLATMMILGMLTPLLFGISFRTVVGGITGTAGFVAILWWIERSKK